MCDIAKALSRAFTAPGTGAFQALESEAQTAATNAETALTNAINNANAASLPAADNPSAAAASKAQMAKLMAGSATQFAFGAQPTVAPPTATKVLMGD